MPSLWYAPSVFSATCPRPSSALRFDSISCWSNRQALHRRLPLDTEPPSKSRQPPRQITQPRRRFPRRNPSSDGSSRRRPAPSSLQPAQQTISDRRSLNRSQTLAPHLFTHRDRSSAGLNIAPRIPSLPPPLSRGRNPPQPIRLSRSSACSRPLRLRLNRLRLCRQPLLSDKRQCRRSPPTMQSSQP